MTHFSSCQSIRQKHSHRTRLAVPSVNVDVVDSMMSSRGTSPPPQAGHCPRLLASIFCFEVGGAERRRFCPLSHDEDGDERDHLNNRQGLLRLFARQSSTSTSERVGSRSSLVSSQRVKPNAVVRWAGRWSVYISQSIYSRSQGGSTSRPPESPYDLMLSSCR